MLASGFCLAAYCFRKDIRAGRLLREHQRRTIQARKPAYDAIFYGSKVKLTAPDYAVNDQSEWPEIIAEYYKDDKDLRGNGGGK
jgi:hypothetical protein